MAEASLPFVVLRATGWECFRGLVHGFSYRLPGHEDLPSGPGPFFLCRLRQVHGNTVVVLRSRPAARPAARQAEKRPVGDALVTRRSGLLLAVAAADCVPILLVEPAARVVAAVHAGWRGTQNGVVPAVMDMLRDRFSTDPSLAFAALGPSIGPCCYQVGSEVGQGIVGRWGEAVSAAWRPDGAKGFLDLRLANAALLERAGVKRANIQYVGPCTACCNDRFASYRREGGGAGRQLSVIGWAPQAGR